MNRIIKKLKVAFKANKAQRSSISCNYENNYYGDQICKMEKAENK